MNATSRERYAHLLMNTFGSPQLVLARGEGCYVWDEDGRRYLDLLAGIAVNALGHAHPRLVQALSQQLATLGHISNFFASQPQLDAAEMILQRVCPNGVPEGSRVFFANSGTEANEAAIKLVRMHAQGRPRLIALNHAFHGRTTGALALTWKSAYRDPFAPLLPGVTFIDPTIEALQDAWDDRVGGIFVEPIQGEAGVRPVPDDFMLRARRLCDATGALLVCDEVQTGVGRTGRWMAHHHVAGLRPDVVTLAKGLGGGFPVGACVGIGAAGRVFQPGAHGTTFGGNPLAAAAVKTTLQTITDEGLVEHAQRVGHWLRQQLRQRFGANLADVRGRGLLVALQLYTDVAPRVVRELLDAGVIANAATPNTIRLAPPLIITRDQLGDFMDALGPILARI